MNTTSGHQMTTLIWRSDNGLWTIQKHERYERSGERESLRYTLTDGRPGCTMYEIDGRFIDHVRRCLDLYKTHQVPTPAYVCRAILRHCPEV